MNAVMGFSFARFASWNVCRIGTHGLRRGLCACARVAGGDGASPVSTTDSFHHYASVVIPSLHIRDGASPVSTVASLYFGGASPPPGEPPGAPLILKS